MGVESPEGVINNGAGASVPLWDNAHRGGCSRGKSLTKSKGRTIQNPLAIISRISVRRKSECSLVEWWLPRINGILALCGGPRHDTGDDRGAVAL